MKTKDIKNSLNFAVGPLPISICQGAEMVYIFLYDLEQKSSWWEGILLRGVLGFVSQFKREYCNES